MPNPPQPPPPQASQNLPAAPPSDPTQQKLIDLLVAAAGLYVTAKLVAGLLSAPVDVTEGVLRLTGMTEQPVRRQTGYSATVTSINEARRRRQVMGPGTDTTGRTGEARWLRSGNMAYRAAYIRNAIGRVTTAVKNGTALSDALATEQGYYRLHVHAAKQRSAAVAGVQTAARAHGRVLGWYAHDDDKTTPDCAAADGRNFLAASPPVIGYPGAVHPHCRCRPGPPHARAGWVNDAVRNLPVAATNPTWTAGSYLTDTKPVDTRWC